MLWNPSGIFERLQRKNGNSPTWLERTTPKLLQRSQIEWIVVWALSSEWITVDHISLQKEGSKDQKDSILPPAQKPVARGNPLGGIGWGYFVLGRRKLLSCSHFCTCTGLSSRNNERDGLTINIRQWEKFPFLSHVTASSANDSIL